MSSAIQAATSAKPRHGQAKLTTRPLTVRAPGNTATGKRIRDLYRAFMAAMGEPVDAVSQAAVLRACELMTAAETARAALLAGQGDIDQVVKLEGSARRAVADLRIGRAKPVQESLQEYAARKRGAA